MTRDLEGKIIAITGANIGIGRAVARELAARGAQLRLLCRSLERIAPLIDELGDRAIAIECEPPHAVEGDDRVGGGCDERRPAGASRGQGQDRAGEQQSES